MVSGGKLECPGCLPYNCRFTHSLTHTRIHLPTCTHHTHSYLLTYTCPTRPHAHSHLHTHAHTHHTYMCTLTPTHMHTPAHTHMHTPTLTHTHAHTYTHTHDAHTHTHAHTYTHAQTHTHTPTCTHWSTNLLQNNTQSDRVLCFLSYAVTLHNTSTLIRTVKDQLTHKLVAHIRKGKGVCVCGGVCVGWGGGVYCLCLHLLNTWFNV